MCAMVLNGSMRCPVRSLEVEDVMIDQLTDRIGYKYNKATSLEREKHKITGQLLDWATAAIVVRRARASASQDKVGTSTRSIQ